MRRDARSDATSATLLDYGQPTAQQIHAVLRQEVLTLALPPGQLVSEAETGTRFGASRTPVREAMTRLRDEGLIVTRPSRGNYVTRLSEGSIRSAQFIREALETAALDRIAATGLTEAAEAALGAALADQKRVLTPTEALAAGADHIVVGRPIHAADDPRRAVEAILANLPPRTT
jgi:DNA-binding GntR family transcriptional regulator